MYLCVMSEFLNQLQFRRMGRGEYGKTRIFIIVKSCSRAHAFLLGYL
jgi:hypothetical protein